MKFATCVLAYNQDKWIMRNIENSYPHVDRIYVGYSKVPWNYDPESRFFRLNNFDINIIKDSKYIDKITIIEGNWFHEFDERNEILNTAKKDGMDYLMIHDADEFYFHEDFEKLKKIVYDNPGYDSYAVQLCAFWKSFKYVLITPQRIEEGKQLGGKISGMAETVLDLSKNLKFIHIRYSGAKKYLVLDRNDLIFYHASYVLTNEELYNKIKTWAHRNDFDPDKWYVEKWLNWTLDTKILHPIYNWAWTHAEKYNEKLPEVIEDLKNSN
jgi:hypothetical protein